MKSHTEYLMFNLPARMAFVMTGDLDAVRTPVQVQGPARVTDPVFLDPNVTITILDTVDGLLKLIEDSPNNISCRAECKRQCQSYGDTAVANCKTDFECNSTNAPSGTVVNSQFRAGFYRCDPIKRAYDLDNVIPEESLY